MTATTEAGDDPTPRFYDELADLFHLVYPDWERSIGAQGLPALWVR